MIKYVAITLSILLILIFSIYPVTNNIIQTKDIRAEYTSTSIKVFHITEVSTFKVWHTEEDFEWIDSVLLYDYDQDGTEEIIVLHWRYGDYFDDKEYLEPIRGEDKLSQHINIYSTKPYVKLVWGGSTMDPPLVNLHICENEINLCARESTYENFPEELREVELDWDGWWFSRKMKGD